MPVIYEAQVSGETKKTGKRAGTKLIGFELEAV